MINYARRNSVACRPSVRSVKSRLHAAASFVAVSIVATSNAHAQDVPDTESQEIIVTAQGREEALQDVPISISVLGGEELETSTFSGVADALRTVPGVATFTSGQNNGTLLNIRGVGAMADKFAGTSTIGYYLDGVPFGLVRSAVVPDASPYDLDRVEVLRGPQGTRYGANSQNGVVRIITRDPNLAKTEFKARGLLALTEDGEESTRADLALNVPIVTDALAVRAVLSLQNDGGWIDNPDGDDANDADILTGRLKIRGQVTDNLSVTLSSWISRSDFGGTPGSLPDLTTPYRGESTSTDYDIHALAVDYEFPGFTVVSTSSFMDYKAHGFNDQSSLAPIFGLPELFLETRDEAEVLTQEISLNSRGQGPWRWSLGGIYREGSTRLFQNFGPITPVPLDVTYKSTSFAVFGELTRLFFNDRLELTAGLRYFRDSVHQTENQNFPPASVIVDRTSKFDKFSPRFVLTWHQSDDLMFYASYAEGFRSGFDQSLTAIAVAPNFPPVREDNLVNYEVGTKGSLWGGRLAFDAAAFFIDWSGVQQSLGVPFGASAVTAGINGESASGMGAEFAITAKLLKGLSVVTNFGWNDLGFDHDVFTFAPANPTVPILAFAKGDRLNYSPEYTAGVGLDYGFPLGKVRGRLSASANYVSKMRTRMVTGGTVLTQPGEDQLFARARFAIEAPEGWAASLFIDNLTDERAANPRNLFEPGRSIRSRPRTFGLQIEYDM